MKDLFSQQAALYAQYRPVYPQELYDYILSFVHNRHKAWDCATGSGQAAVALASYFDEVYATDISDKQLQQAAAHPNIIYSRASAEATDFPDHQFDLITVAQAYHWFRFDDFRREVERVAHSDGVIAIWGYGLLVCEEEAINQRIQLFYRDTIGSYWDEERKYVDEHYTTIPFPYDELPARDFRINVRWTKEMLSGYLNTWSAVQHYIKDQQHNPVNGFVQKLNTVWEDNTSLEFYFPVFLRLGRTR